MSKSPRADFALPENKSFPLNTPGRRKVAVKDAVASERAGNITSSQVDKVRRAVAAKRPVTNARVEATKADKAADKRNGTKEGSPADMRQDAALKRRIAKNPTSFA